MNNADKAKARQPEILRPSRLPSRDRGGGARTVPLVTRQLGATGFINGITIFAPGASIPLHSHNCEESVMILEGRAILELNGVEHEVGPEDTTFLPANIPHRFKNASTTAPMRIFWTYASVDATRTLADSGETHAIDAEYSK